MASVISTFLSGKSAFLEVFKGPKPLPTAADPRVKEAKVRQRRALAARRGRKSTILGAASGEREEEITPTRLLGG